MRTGESGLYKDFGKLYDPLFVRKDNPLPDFMREAFKQYLTTRWDGGTVGRCNIISLEMHDTKTYMTKSEAAKKLNVAAQTVNLLNKNGYLRGTFDPLSSKRHVLIEADSVRALNKRWRESIPVRQVGEILGISRRAVVSLIKSGCLDAIQGPTVTGQLEWKIEVSEVERLLRFVKGKISEGKGLTPVLSISFYKAIQKLSKISIKVGSFVRLILDGEILPISQSTGTGLSGLLFDQKQVKELSILKSIQCRGTKRTMQEATKLLHSAHDVVQFFIQRGLLLAEKVRRGGVETFVIEQDEIARFINTYSTTGQIARSLCTSSRFVSRRLMETGIMPVSGPKVDGGKLYWFKKSDIESVDLSSVRAAAKESMTQQVSNKGFVSIKAFG